MTKRKTMASKKQKRTPNPLPLHKTREEVNNIETRKEAAMTIVYYAHSPVPPVQVKNIAEHGPVYTIKSSGAKGLLMYDSDGSMTLVSLNDGAGFSLSPGAAQEIGELLTSWAKQKKEKVEPASSWFALAK